MQEAMREAGKYDPDATNLFRGISQGCTKGYIGLKNCCKTDTAAGQDNNSVMAQMLTDAGGAGAKQAANLGSKYAYDFLYSDTGWLGSGSSCVSTLFEPTNFSASFGAYGFTASSAGGAAPTFLGTVATELGSMSGFTVYFNPYALAFAVAMQIIMEMIECTPEEQKLSMARGANLCTYVGSYCSTKVLGGCVETKQNYCCFNSKLSRIINEQGRPQLGRTLGTAKDPDCRGFTADEFSQMDWSKIDMGEFVTDIMSSVQIPNADEIGKRMTDNMSSRISNNPTFNNPTLPAAK
jgi:conjugal transfer mating pair stabilization protein TraN